MQDALPQCGWLHAADEPQQQVHESRGAEVLQHQADKLFFLLQEHQHLETSTGSAAAEEAPMTALR